MSSNKDARSTTTVWEEAGGEFYTENYNKNTRVSTVNRIPLPSQTARRNSAWKSGGSNIYTHRRTGTTRTMGDYGILDGMPDLADESLGNEKTMYHQRQAFKDMPVSMAEKRTLKTQLNANPVLKLTGWAGIQWRLERIGKGCIYPFRNMFDVKYFRGQLRSVESRFGHVFNSYFEEVKTILFINLLMAVLIGAYFLHPHAQDLFYQFTNTSEPHLLLLNMTQNIDIEWGNLTQMLYDRSSFLYHGSSVYEGSVVFLVTGVYFTITCLCVVYQICRCVRDQIAHRYVQNYYSDLIFSGWDHFTNCKSGADFKKAAIQGKLKAELYHEILEQRNTLGVVGIRTCVNVIVVGLTSISLLFTWHLQQFCHSNTKRITSRSYNAAELLLCFAPQMFVVACWTFLSIITERMGKWEKYEYKERISVLVIRCWLIRAAFLGIFFLKIYLMLYSSYLPDENAPVASSSVVSVIRVDTYEVDENYCWESEFAKEIYKFFIVDIGLKTFMAFVIEPIRALCGKLCHIGYVHFHIVSSYMDALTIQALSLLGIYFSPLMPIGVVLHSFLLFYVKSFGLLVNVRGSPDIFRSIRGAVIKSKILTYTICACLMLYVISSMKPSTTCGPFKDLDAPMDYVNATVVTQVTSDFIPYIKCPTWSLPLMVIFLFGALYYKCLTKRSERMIGTLRHLLVLEGHDKQFLFRRVEALQSNA